MQLFPLDLLPLPLEPLGLDVSEFGEQGVRVRDAGAIVLEALFVSLDLFVRDLWVQECFLQIAKG